MYSTIFEKHSLLLKAMAHPKRLEVIHLLRNQKLSVTEIQQMLDLSQANLSQHLQILRAAHVVKFKKEGKQIFYKLSNQNFIKASDLLRQVLLESGDTHKMSDLLPIGIDPICKMKLTPKSVAFTHTHQGKVYYFCASNCLKTFIKNIQ